MYQDGVRIMILPEGAACLADDDERSPLDLEECPCGHETCLPECEWYTKRWG